MGIPLKWFVVMFETPEEQASVEAPMRAYIQALDFGLAARYGEAYLQTAKEKGLFPSDTQITQVDLIGTLVVAVIPYGEKESVMPNTVLKIPIRDNIKESPLTASGDAGADSGADERDRFPIGRDSGLSPRDTSVTAAINSGKTGAKAGVSSTEGEGGPGQVG